MNVPEDMRAAFIRKTGGIGEIEIGRLPVPRPGPTDVLVRMEASEVNRVDLFVRSGAYRTHTPFPFVIGRDLVGTVADAGPGASFSVGDRVWCNSLGHAGRQGAFAEYALVACDRLYPLPPEADSEQAAAVLHTAATAHIGLVRGAGLQFGETLFVEGAGGGVGSAVLQLAAAIGARVIATASAEDEGWVRACGADAVFDYRRKDLYERVREAAPDGIDVWWDNSGRHRFADCLPMMRLGGRAIVMAGLAGESSSLPVGAMYTRDVSLVGFAISNASVADLSAAAATVNRLLAAGRLKARVEARYHLSEAAKAHEAMEKAHVKGRIVVLP